MNSFLVNYGPIFALLAVIAFVHSRLPKTDVGHSPEFMRRRFWNWFPLGMTYALLYMGRYNLTVAKNAMGELISNADFGMIFGGRASQSSDAKSD